VGIAANTAIFTVTNALLLRPFPYHDPDQLMSLHGRTLLRYELVRRREPLLPVSSRMGE